MQRPMTLEVAGDALAEAARRMARACEYPLRDPRLAGVSRRQMERRLYELDVAVRAWEAALADAREAETPDGASCSAP